MHKLYKRSLLKRIKNVVCLAFFLLSFYIIFSGTGNGSSNEDKGGGNSIDNLSDGEGYNRVTLEGGYNGRSFSYDPIYFNIRTGKEVDVSKRDTKEWDIMFKGSYIYTNSGSSASVEHGTGSLGNGGWCFTDLKGLEALRAIVLDDIDPNSINIDYRAWINENPFTQGEVNCNGMLLLTTTNGSGTKGDPYKYTISNIKKVYDDKAIIWLKGIPPKCYSTDRVYIIRCARGKSLGKLMFGSFSQGSYFMNCKYQVIFYYKCFTDQMSVDITSPSCSINRSLQ